MKMIMKQIVVLKNTVSNPNLFLAELALVAFAFAPCARAANITSCDQTSVQNAVDTGNAVFQVNCHLLLTGPITIPVGDTSISANGYAVTFDGQGVTGVITVAKGVTLWLFNLNIINGKTPSGEGGGISNAGTLLVFNGGFSNNQNAIQNTGSLLVDVATFTGNYSSSGGGAIVHIGPSEAQVSGATFGNPSQAGGNSATEGGAIYVAGTTMQITNSSFYGNVATQRGRHLRLRVHLNPEWQLLSGKYHESRRCRWRNREHRE